MNKETFISKFAEAIEDDTISALPVTTNFRELDSWDSLAALSIMAMIDEEYQVNLSAEEMRAANTFQELIDLISSKKA